MGSHHWCHHWNIGDSPMEHWQPFNSAVIWIISILLSLPYLINSQLVQIDYEDNIYQCKINWENQKQVSFWRWKMSNLIGQFPRLLIGLRKNNENQAKSRTMFKNCCWRIECSWKFYSGRFSTYFEASGWLIFGRRRFDWLLETPS